MECVLFYSSASEIFTTTTTWRRHGLNAHITISISISISINAPFSAQNVGETELWYFYVITMNKLLRK